MNSEEAQEKDETYADVTSTYYAHIDFDVADVESEGEGEGEHDADVDVAAEEVEEEEKKTKKRQKKKKPTTIQVSERTTQNTVVEKTPQKYPSTTPPKATKDEGIDGEGQPVLLERSSRPDPQALVYAVGQLVG